MTGISPDKIPPGVDLSKPSAARVYDWYLGGGHHWEIDREFGRKAMTILPNIKEVALFNRAFLTRAVRYGLGHGVAQFLDVGAGIPTVGNVHEIAQSANPDARVVYADNEPVAVSHGQLILGGNERASVIRADLHEPDGLLGHPECRRLLDFDRPVMVIMAAVLHFVGPDDDPVGLLRRYIDALAPGSYLVLSHMTSDGAPPEMAAHAERFRASYDGTTNPLFLRDRAEFAGWFDGLTLIEPGIVYTPEWRPDYPQDRYPEPARSLGLAGVGLK